MVALVVATGVALVVAIGTVLAGGAWSSALAAVAAATALQIVYLFETALQPLIVDDLPALPAAG